MIEQYDNLECRCRILGHTVPFKYCRTVQDRLPCSKIMDCWFRRIPVQDFIKNNYSEEEIKQILGQPHSKMESLMNMIERIKKNS